MSSDRSSLDDDIEFGTAGRTPSPLGGGGTTNIGGGTSGAGQGNSNTVRNSTNPAADIVDTDMADDASAVAGGMNERSGTE